MSNAKTPRTRKPVTLSQVIAKEAANKGIAPDKAGKAIRSYLRRHDVASLEKAGYTGLSKAKAGADGNRWPAMPATFARKVLDRKVTTK